MPHTKWSDILGYVYATVIRLFNIIHSDVVRWGNFCILHAVVNWSNCLNDANEWPNIRRFCRRSSEFAVMRSSQMVSGLLASPILIAFQEMHTVRMAVIRIVIGRTRFLQLIPTKGTHRHKPDNICRLYFHRSDRHQPTLCHDLVGQKGYFTDIKRNVLFIPVTSAHRNNFQPQPCTCPQNQCKFSIAFAKKSPI